MRSVSSYSVLFTIWLQLLLCWLPFSLGQTCTSTGEDGNSSCSANPKNLSCRVAHQDQLFNLCNNIKDQQIDRLETCPYHDHCPVLTSSIDSTNIELMPIELHAVDIRFFAIHISWHHPIKVIVGYEITILKEQDILRCICINGTDQHSIHIRGSEKFNKLVYSSSAGSGLTVEIHPVQMARQDVKSTQTVQWPTSCLDIHFNKSTCGSPVFHPPSNIMVIGVCDSLSNFSVDLRWDYNTLTFPPPSLYYIDIFSEERIDDLYPLFRFVASRTTSVRIQLPNDSLNYNFTIQPYGNCSGIANYTNSPGNGIGCGRRSEVLPFPSCLKILPTTATTVVASTFVYSRATKPNYLLVRVCSGEGAAVLIIVALLVIISCIVWRVRLWEQVPVQRDSTPSQIAFSVLVVHSPKADAMGDIQMYIVCPLRDSFDVVTSGDMMCGDIVEWIEVQVRERSAVLLVITKEFFSEWEEHSNKSQVVRATQRLLTSAVAQNILDKYAIVVLDDEMKTNYIPDNHYMKSLRVFVLGKKKNEIDSLCRFVTKTSPFEHSGRAASSSISSSSSSDLDILSGRPNPNQPVSSRCDLPSMKHRMDLFNRTDVIMQSISPAEPTDQIRDGGRVACSQYEQNLTQQLLKVLDQPSWHLVGETTCDLP